MILNTNSRSNVVLNTENKISLRLLFVVGQPVYTYRRQCFVIFNTIYFEYVFVVIIMLRILCELA